MWSQRAIVVMPVPYWAHSLKNWPFFLIYAKAKRTNNAGFFLDANQARSHVEIARLLVIDQIQDFPQAVQDQMTLAIGQVGISLEQNPSFPEPLNCNLNNDALPNFINRIQNRGTTSEVNAPVRRGSLPAIKAPPHPKPTPSDVQTSELIPSQTFRIPSDEFLWQLPRSPLIP